MAVKGICDGKEIKALEKLLKNKKYKVLITLLEEVHEDERITPADTEALSFWNDKRRIFVRIT